MSKIQSLTAEQEAKMPEFAEKWIKIGLDTSRTSPEQFEECFEVVVNLYKASGEDPPSKYTVVESPIGIGKICKENSFISNCCYGSFESGWLSNYSFFRDVVGIEIDSRIDGFITLSKYVSWWCVYNGCAIFSQKPIEINMRDGRLLHNESGPSIRFADGFCVWSIEGHHVTEQIVMRPETMTIKQIDSEKNSDIQAIMLERFGWERYIDESGAVAIDSRQNDIENTLEILYDTPKFGRRLVCTCPTGRVFVKGVETTEDTSTCEGAQNWLSGYTNSKSKKSKFRTIART
jgi:hypothetical protein